MKKIIALSLFVFLYQVNLSQVWTKKSAIFTGTGVRATTSFSIPSLGKGYVVGGSPSDFATWAYDTLSGSWSQCQNFPGGADGTQVGFSINNIGYAGTGVSWGCGIYNTFFKYDPVANNWSQLPNVPGLPRGYAVGFAMGGKGYIGGGDIGCYLGGLNDFYSYDPATNKWDTIAPCPEKGCNLLAVGFSIGNYGYVGTGDTLNAGGSGTPVKDFYQYDPTSNTWTKKADFPGGPAVGASGFATCDKGYIGLGQRGPNQNIYTRDFYQYNPINNIWKQIANFGGVSRAVAPSFVIGNSCFVGLGFDSTASNSSLTDLWEYIPSYTPAFSADSSVCSGGTISFTDTSNYSPTNWKWSFPGGIPNSSTLSNPVIKYDTAGTFDVTITAFNGCDSATKTFVKYVSVNASPVLTISPSSPKVCSGQSIILSVNGGGSAFKWSPSTALNISTGDSVVATGFPSLDSIVYTVTDTSSLTCPATGHVTLHLGGKATGGTVTALRDTICQGTKGSLTLSGFSGSPFQWQFSNKPGNFANISSANDTAYQTLPLSQSTWYRVLVDTGACSGISDTLQLFVPPALTASFYATESGNTEMFNSDSSIGNIVTYSWTFGDGTGSNLKNPMHTYKTDTTYNVCLTIYDGSNCSYTFCRNITISTGIPFISAQKNWNIYPNPFNDNLIISGKDLNKEIESIEIYDVLGRTVFSETPGELNDNPLLLNVSGLSQGMYFLKIRAGETDYLQKVVK